ncbi:MAG: NUDIX hydrolase [Anaerolineae bacterium]
MAAVVVGPSLDEVRRALKAPKPGLSAQKRMAVRPRPGGHHVPPGHQPKDGGVLILLYPKDAQLHLPLTRRTDTVANHKGQISLPGGARETGDRSLEETALRETREELNIDLQRVEILGALTPLYIPVSGYLIHPFVAFCAERPDFNPDPIEVAELLEVPLASLLDPATRREEDWKLVGMTVRVPFFQVGEHKVWGATAMVLSEFVVILQRANAGCDSG